MLALNVLTTILSSLIIKILISDNLPDLYGYGEQLK